MPSASEMIQISLLGEALERGPALVFVADDQMKYVAVNRLAAESLGYAREELLGMRVTDVAREESAPDDYQEMMRKRWRVGTAILTRKDGSQVRFSYRASNTTIAQMDFFVSVGFLEDEDVEN
jgi:PAS domain S-box-containing protein